MNFEISDSAKILSLASPNYIPAKWKSKAPLTEINEILFRNSSSHPDYYLSFVLPNDFTNHSRNGCNHSVSKRQNNCIAIIQSHTDKWTAIWIAFRSGIINFWILSYLNTMFTNFEYTENDKRYLTIQKFRWRRLLLWFN